MLFYSSDQEVKVCSLQCSHIEYLAQHMRLPYIITVGNIPLWKSLVPQSLQLHLLRFPCVHNYAHVSNHLCSYTSSRVQVGLSK